MDLSMVLRLLVIILFLCSAAISLFAYFKRGHPPHLLGIALWCIHVVGFTVIAMLVALDVLTINRIWLNIWSNTVRLHGGIVVFTTGIFYIFRPTVKLYKE